MKLQGFVLGLIVAAAGIVISQAPAKASVIGINFTGGTDGTGHPVAASDQPGIVPGANWNNEDGSSGSGLTLNDSTGTSTTALLTFSATSAYGLFTGVSTPNSGTNTMYLGGLVGNHDFSEVSITVTGIPYGSYDVYVYASADTVDRSTLGITLGGTTFYYAGDGTQSSPTSLLLTTSTTLSDPTIGPGQYQIFSGLSGSSLNVATSLSVSNVLSNNVFGLEIVDTTPEPSSLFSLAGGIGLLALVAVRRRGARAQR